MHAGWIIAGGLAAAGGFLWWKSRQGTPCGEYANQLQQTANAAGYGYYGSYAAAGVNLLCKLGGVEAVQKVATAVTAPLSALGGALGGGDYATPPICMSKPFSEECKAALRCIAAGLRGEEPSAECKAAALADTTRSHVGMTATTTQKEPPPPAPILSDRPALRYTRPDGTSVVDYRTR